MRQALCHLCFFLCGIIPGAAQGRSAWFACTSIPDGVTNPVKVVTGNKLTELKLHRYMTSDPVRIPADGVIRIVREAQAGNPEIGSLGLEQVPAKFLVLAQAQVPSNVSKALIILIPLEKPEGDLIFKAKVQDLAAFKGGDRMYINQSNSHIRVKLGDTKVDVAPERTSIFKAPVLAKPANMPISYDFFHPKEEKWKMFSASTTVLRPTRRSICIFNSGSRPGNIKKHKILFPLPVESKEP